LENAENGLGDEGADEGNVPLPKNGLEVPLAFADRITIALILELLGCVNQHVMN